MACHESGQREPCTGGCCLATLSNPDEANTSVLPHHSLVQDLSQPGPRLATHRQVVGPGRRAWDVIQVGRVAATVNARSGGAANMPRFISHQSECSSPHHTPHCSLARDLGQIGLGRRQPPRQSRSLAAAQPPQCLQSQCLKPQSQPRELSSPAHSTPKA